MPVEVVVQPPIGDLVKVLVVLVEGVMDLSLGLIILVIQDNIIFLRILLVLEILLPKV